MNLFSIGSGLIDKPRRTRIKTSRRPIITSKVGSAGVVYGALGNTVSRSSFEKAEYNLGEISKVLDIEAYVRQAFDKHVEMCLKEGYELSSRNEKATVYIKKRLREMSEASAVTFDMIIRSITQNMVAYSNSFIVKVRDARRSSGNPIMRTAGEILPPVAAYFPLDPTSVQIKRNMHGKVLRYLQKIPGNPRAPEFRPEDMVHIYYDRKEGFAFGTPYSIPVLDDIRSLRRLEESIEMLMNQHLFPLFQYTVGTEDNPAEMYDDGTTEVDYIKEQIENMPTEGSIVTPERHDIKAIGAEGKALEVSKYLEYFEKRVLAGLGISEIALGRGGTANRSTATVIDKMMQDRCKDFQDVMEGFINEFILKELLYEGGFIIDETEDNFVKLKFKEIDIDTMLKFENHSVYKYEHDAITETELRELLGKDPISEEQRGDMYFEKITKPKAIILAVDEPYTAEAKANGAIKKVSKEEKKKRETSNREKPTNQHGTKPAKTRSKQDVSDNIERILAHLWYLTQLDVVDLVSDSDNLSEMKLEKLKPIVNITYDDIISRLSGFEIDHSLLDFGIKDILNDLGDYICVIARKIKKRDEVISKIPGVFGALRYRLRELSEKIIK